MITMILNDLSILAFNFSGGPRDVPVLRPTLAIFGAHFHENLIDRDQDRSGSIRNDPKSIQTHLEHIRNQYFQEFSKHTDRPPNASKT